MAACKHLSKSVILYKLCAVTPATCRRVYVGSLLVLSRKNTNFSIGSCATSTYEVGCRVRSALPTSESLVLPLFLVWAFTSVRSTQPFHLKPTIASFHSADAIVVIHTFKTGVLIATESMRLLAGYIGGVGGVCSCSPPGVLQCLVLSPRKATSTSWSSAPALRG